MAMINSVTGPVDSADLGFTLTHEHVCSVSAGFWQAWPELFGGREAFIEKVSAELAEVKAGGVDTFVDVTTIDLGRDIRLIREVAERSGLRIIACTGHWLDPSRTMQARTVEELTAYFIREIEEGIEGTDVKAGIIKVANDDPGDAPLPRPQLTSFGEKLLRAAARAQKATGVPITTHAGARNRWGDRQVEVFEDEGVDPSRVYVGHSDDTDSMSYLTGLLQRGYWVGFDRLPWGNLRAPLSVDERATTVASLIEQGYESQMCLSHDYPLGLGLAPTDYWETARAANPDGVLFLSRKFIPLLREKGVSEATIDRITRENPRRYFEGS